MVQVNRETQRCRMLLGTQLYLDPTAKNQSAVACLYVDHITARNNEIITAGKNSYGSIV